MMINQLIVKPLLVDLLPLAFVNCDIVCALLSKPGMENLSVTSAAPATMGRQRTAANPKQSACIFWTHHA